jgi:hypothetical protein
VQNSLRFGLSLVCSILEVIAPSYSQVISINISRWMERGFLTGDNFISIFMSWNKVTANYVADFLMLGCYVFAAVGTCNFWISNIPEEFYALLYLITIKFANSPPCACRGSSGQNPQDGLMTFTIWKYRKGCVKKLDGNDPNFLPTTHGSCIRTMHLLTRHCLWGSF